MNIHRLVSLLAILYAGIVLLFVLTQRTHRRRPQPNYPWLYQALAPFAFWLALLALPLLALAPLVRQPAYTTATLAATALFLWHYAPRWSRAKMTPNVSRTRDLPLRVMTSNLFKANDAYAAIAEAILASKADLVAVQELRPPQAEALSTLLREAYPHQELRPGRDAEGMGLFSRHPITRREFVCRDGANPIQVIQVHLTDEALSLINIHPRIPMLQQSPALGFPTGLSTAERAQDIETIIAAAESLSTPTLILGDMNTTPYCPAFGVLPSDWRDVHQEVGQGMGFSYPVDAAFFGFRSPLPLFRIDHLFLRGAVQARSVSRGHMPGSDHRYLLADLLLPTSSFGSDTSGDSQMI